MTDGANLCMVKVTHTQETQMKPSGVRRDLFSPKLPRFHELPSEARSAAQELLALMLAEQVVRSKTRCEKEHCAHAQ